MPITAGMIQTFATECLSFCRKGGRHCPAEFLFGSVSQVCLDSKVHDVRGAAGGGSHERQGVGVMCRSMRTIAPMAMRCWNMREGSLLRRRPRILLREWRRGRLLRMSLNVLDGAVAFGTGT